MRSTTALFFITAFFAVSVAANPVNANGSPPTTTGSQCNTGAASCCNSVQSASAPGVASLLGLLGILGSVTGQVGLGCTPIIGLLTSGCTAQPVCCTGNNFNGLVNVGCTPLSL